MTASTFASPADAFATAKTKATKGHRDWLVWLAAGQWHAAKLTADLLGTVTGADKVRLIAASGRIHNISAAGLALMVKNAGKV